MTARKPDGHYTRVRGTPVRVGTVVPGRTEVRDSGTPRPTRAAVAADVVEVNEAARDTSAAIDRADDSIGARLEQWETLDEQMRTNQEKGERLYMGLI